MIAVLAPLDISFEPAFVFPGEPFTVRTSEPAAVSSAMVTLKARGTTWYGIGPREPAEIYATIGPPDAYTAAALKVLPVAAGLSIGNIAGIEIVPMHGDIYGAILANRRFPSIATFVLAPRSAPERERPFVIDYVYIGKDSATLAGNAGGLLRASIQLLPGKVVLTGASLFHLTGTVNLLGQRFQIAAGPGERASFEVAIPSYAP